MLPIVAFVLLFGSAAGGVTSQPYSATAAPYAQAPAAYTDNSKLPVYGAQQTYSKPSTTYGTQPTYNSQQAYTNQAYGNQAYPNQPYNPPYTNYGGSYNQVDLNAEVNQVKENIAGLYANANQLSSALNANSLSIDGVAEFSANVDGTIAPRVRGLIKSQDYKIKEYRERLSELLVLRDEVEQLAQLVADVRKLRAEDRSIRVQAIFELENRQTLSVRQDIDIVELQALSSAENAHIEKVKGQIYQNQNKNGELSDNLDSVLKTVNLERAETFTQELSRNQPSATLSFSSSFASVPALQWGVIELKLKQKEYSQNSYDGSQNSYDGSQNSNDGSYSSDSYDKNMYNIESWNFKVSANASSSAVTVSLADKSLNWNVESVLVRVTATLIDNSKLEYVSRNVDYTSSYGSGNYPTTSKPTNKPNTAKPTNYPTTVKPNIKPTTVKPIYQKRQ